MVDTNYNLLPKNFHNTEDSSPNVDRKMAGSVQAGIQAKLGGLPPVQREAFLAMTANLTQGDVGSPDKLLSVLGKFEAAAKFANNAGSAPMVFVGSIASFLARAMIEHAGEQRKSALDDRLAARETAKAELNNQASAMEKSADKMMTGAMTAMITGIAAGAVSAAGSAVSAVGSLSQLSSMGKALNQTKLATQQMTETSDQVGGISKIQKGVSTASDMGKVSGAMKGAESAQASANLSSANKAFDMAQSKTQLFTTLGHITNATGDTSRTVGTGVDSSMQAKAKDIDADGSRDAAEAQEAQQLAELKKDMQDSLSEMMKQIINFIKELRDAEVDAMRALTKV